MVQLVGQSAGLAYIQKLVVATITTGPPVACVKLVHCAARRLRELASARRPLSAGGA